MSYSPPLSKQRETERWVDSHSKMSLDASTSSSSPSSSHFTALRRSNNGVGALVTNESTAVDVLLSEMSPMSQLADRMTLQSLNSTPRRLLEFNSDSSDGSPSSSANVSIRIDVDLLATAATAALVGGISPALSSLSTSSDQFPLLPCQTVQTDSISTETTLPLRSATGASTSTAVQTHCAISTAVQLTRNTSGSLSSHASTLVGSSVNRLAPLCSPLTIRHVTSRTTDDEPMDEDALFGSSPAPSSVFENELYGIVCASNQQLSKSPAQPIGDAGFKSNSADGSFLSVRQPTQHFRAFASVGAATANDDDFRKPTCPPQQRKYGASLTSTDNDELLQLLSPFRSTSPVSGDESGLASDMDVDRSGGRTAGNSATRSKITRGANGSRRPRPPLRKISDITNYTVPVPRIGVIESPKSSRYAASVPRREEGLKMEVKKATSWVQQGRLVPLRRKRAAPQQPSHSVNDENACFSKRPEAKLRKHSIHSFSPSDGMEMSEQSLAVEQCTKFVRSFSTSVLPHRTAEELERYYAEKDEKHYSLPETVAPQKKDPAYRSISPNTLVEIFKQCGNEAEFNKKFVLIDCRYPYEYENGHIQYAVNIPYLRSHHQLHQHMFPDEDEQGRQVDSKLESVRKRTPILYCEFSKERGPKSAAYLRNHDRNRNSFPEVLYDEIYLLDRGYRNFFREDAERRRYCTPNDYVEMEDVRYKDELRKWKLRSKSFAGERPGRSHMFSRSKSTKSLFKDRENNFSSPSAALLANGIR